MKRVVSFSIDTELVQQLENKSWEMRKSRSELLESYLKAGLGGLNVKVAKKSEVVKKVAQGKAEDFKKEIDLEAENKKLMEKRKALSDAPKRGVDLPQSFFNPRPKGDDR